MQTSWMGFGVGLLAGVTAALLTAPQRGAATRAHLRTRMTRRRAAPDAANPLAASHEGADSARPSGLTATLGEISQLHAGGPTAPRKAWS